MDSVSLDLKAARLQMEDTNKDIQDTTSGYPRTYKWTFKELK